MERLKRAVIKEEFVAITGDFIKAILLNQFIYWSERVLDFDEFIKQENERAVNYGLQEIDLTCGWIYKTAEELSVETMIDLSVASIRTHIKALIDKGFIAERNNPKYKWDRTKQYRVNLLEISKSLNEMGFFLEGYKIELPFSKIKNGTFENLNAIPNITTKSIKEINNNACTREEESNEDLYNKLLKIVQEHCPILYERHLKWIDSGNIHKAGELIDLVDFVYKRYTEKELIELIKKADKTYIVLPKYANCDLVWVLNNLERVKGMEIINENKPTVSQQPPITPKIVKPKVEHFASERDYSKENLESLVSNLSELDDIDF